MSKESNSNIMSVGEMIDTAFGEPDVNVVNHKLIQTILYILARQLRVLERRVEIEIGTAVQPSSSTLSITEVKVHAMQKKKRPVKGAASKSGKRSAGSGIGGGGASVDMGGGGAGRAGRVSGPAHAGRKSFGVTEKNTSDKTSSDRTGSSKTPSDKTSSDKTSSQKTSSDKTSSQKTSSDKSASDKTSSYTTSSNKTTAGKTTIGKTTTEKPGKSSTEKSSSDKTSSDKASSDKTSSDKTWSDKTSSEKTTTEKTSTEKASSKSTSVKTTTAKSTSDKTSSEKSSSDKTSTEKTSSDKTSSDKTSSDKTSSDKQSSDKTSTDKTSSDKQSSDKTSSDKQTSDKTSSDRTSSEKPSSSDKSSSDKTSSDKTSSKAKTSTSTTTEKSSGKTTTETSSSVGKGPGDYAKLLETVEMQRETELRVIHQRTDSREEYDKTPSPMASMDSIEATYEKLLVVERIPAEEARAIAARGRSGLRDKTPRLSVVTQDQFEKLAIKVRQLQQKFGPIGSPSFPENEQLMLELRKGASLTDAMAALQLSARLEATEKTLEQMLSLVTDLASKTPGIDLSSGVSARGRTDVGGAAEGDIEVIFGATASKKGQPSKTRSGSPKFQQPAKARKEQSPPSSNSEESVQIFLPHLPVELEVTETRKGADTAEDGKKAKPDQITYEEFDNALQGVYDDILKAVTSLTAKSTVNADNAYQLASKLEKRLDASLDLGNRMQDLETLVSEYADQINVLDTSLSSQMTNYQEELTQMQHDLETALETMAEVLANTGGDTTAVAELNAHFSNLQSDIDDTMMRQKELKNTQNALAFDLESLRDQIEILKETKSDREEVADALRDKAGLGALNGLVSLEQFMAVRGDIEKRIGTAYEKFNSQETIWQKVIDDLLRELNEKADWFQLVSLKEDINRHLDNLRARLNAMVEIVGEPKAAAVAKKLHRDATCLSCAAPANMELEEPGRIPALPALRPQTIGAEASKPKEDGDHAFAPCYPGLPIPHPRDPRSRVCQRWCGGSHTVIAHTVSRAPPGMVVTPALRRLSTALGTDGKSYMVDEDIKPCVQCIIHKQTLEHSIAEPIQAQDDFGSNMTPQDFRQSLDSVLPAAAEVDVTPPPPQDED